MSLKLEGKIVVKSSIEEVWKAVTDVHAFPSWVPGCEEIEDVEENAYECIVSAQVGPVMARFKSSVRLIDIDPPRHFKAVGQGKDLNKAGNFKGESIVDLREISAGEVEVSYVAKVSIVGRLATFGDRIMIAKAKEVEREATEALNKRLSGIEVKPSKIEVGMVDLFIAFFAGLWTMIKGVFR